MDELAPLLALVLFTLVSLGLGFVAKVSTSRRLGFLRKYFLGNRSLGALAVALTAAVMSGGTFMGFPSLVYTFGWVVGLWISSYMVAGLTILGLMGKRIGQLSRKTGAITLPDLLRERYGSPALGLLTSLLVMLFLTVNLVPQFKAGGILVKSVLPPGVLAALGQAPPPAEARSGTAPGRSAAPGAPKAVDRAYLLGLGVFAATVIVYTAYGGFLAAIWTDVFQSLVMAVGVLVLLPLALAASGGLVAATVKGVEQTDVGFAFGPGAGRDFHPWTLAVSFFVMWAISGAGQPSTMVRLMAYRNSRTLRYSIIYLTLYNAIVYIPLILIFVCARSILPGLAGAGLSDEIMPRLVHKLSPSPYLAGFILAAPYGAVMSTVSGFLLIVASGLVRDVYQRFLKPTATEREIERASYAGTVLVGVVVAVVAIWPPEYLQLLIVFSGSGMAASFLAPAFLGCYWRRATPAGALAAMGVGAGVTLGLYLLGTFGTGALGLERLLGANPEIGAASAFRPFYLLGFDPCVWGIGLSFLAGGLVSLATRPPDPARVALLFDAQPAGAPAPATLALHPGRPAPAAEETTP
jgi:SSS family solute:Na+ symporter/sodium/pantothenate symporter